MEGCDRRGVMPRIDGLNSVLGDGNVSVPIREVDLRQLQRSATN
jgi:hypothetical protein